MAQHKEPRPRAREIGITVGTESPGPLNAITDVPGVRVGHVSLIRGEGDLHVGEGPVRTGVTAVLPHGGNLFASKVRAAGFILNGFGKSVGLPQLDELGCIETPLLLTGTLNTWRVADALVDYAARSNPGVYSFNPVVCECNDSRLNDALGRHVTAAHVLAAIECAQEGPVAEGNVGAGVGMTAFGWKAGIGTASRTGRVQAGPFTVGALVLANTGEPGELRVGGIPVGDALRPDDEKQECTDGSIIMLVATDASLCHRQLSRMAKRAALGLGRTGATASHGSGDFAIAFSTTARIDPDGLETEQGGLRVREPELSRLFGTTVEAVEEAILNSLLRAETMTGRDGGTSRAIPVGRLLQLLQQRGEPSTPGPRN